MEILLLVVGCVSTVLAASWVCQRVPVPAPLLLLVIGAVGSYEPWFPLAELTAERYGWRIPEPVFIGRDAQAVEAGCVL